MPVAFQRSHLNEMLTENFNVEIQKLRAIFCVNNLKHYKFKTSLIPTSTPFTRYSFLHFDKESLVLGYLIVECCLCTKTKQTFEDVTPD